jgi:hypothetical protein
MKVSAVLSTAFLALANAASFTNTEINPEPGKPFTLTWSDASGPVNIVLRHGDPKNLDTVETLVSGATGTSATVTLDPDELPSGNYAFMIVDGSGKENYSALFPFSGNAQSLPNQSGSSGTSRPTATTSATGSSSGTSTASDSTETTSASRTRTTSASRTTATGASDTSVPGAAPAVSSPLALILVTIAAMFYFN